MRNINVESKRESASMLTSALEYLAHGLNVLPCKANCKKPVGSWEQWQTIPQTECDLTELFDAHNGNIGILCGSISGNLVVIDCDDHVIFEEYFAEINNKFGSTWVTRTKRGGHIYLRPPWAVVSQKLDKFEIRSEGLYVVAPPSRHPKGGFYEFVTRPPEIIQIQNGDLGFINLRRANNSVLNKNISSTKIEQLTIVALRYKTEKCYQSRSEFDQAVITAGYNMGATISEIQSVLNNAKFDTRYRALDHRGEEYLKLSYSKAVGLGDSKTAKKITRDIEAIREIVDGMRWSGSSALTDKAVLQAHITRCERAKHSIYFLSGRDGSEISKISPATFNKSTQRLVEKGFIHRTHAAIDGLAPQYRLSSPAEIQALVSSLTTTSQVVLDEEVIKQETSQSQKSASYSLGQTDTFGVFERRVLGKAAENVWLALQGPWLTQYEISQVTGRAKGTVSKAVKKLLKHHIISEWGEGKPKVYRALEGFDFERLAGELGASGIAEQRKRKHRAERERYRQIRKNAAKSDFVAE